MSENLPPTGRAGATPPPGAPQETSQPLGRDAGGIAPAVNPRTGEPYATEAWHTMSPVDRARHNERQLEPLKYNTGPKQGGVAEATIAAGEGKLDPYYEAVKARRAATEQPAPPPSQQRRIIHAQNAPRPEVPDEQEAEALPDWVKTDRGGLVVEEREAALVASPAPVEEPPPSLAPIDYSIHPAGSDTDSPSRGVPRGTIDPGKVPSGGFGDTPSAQYFALNGLELLALVESLMDDLHNRLVNDLRFNEALCYPQVGVRVALEVTGFARDNDFIIDQVLPATHEARSRTPVEIARDVADQVAFVVIAERRETSAEGEPLDAPDAIRQDLGLARPGKRLVRGPTGMETFVDV